MLLQRESWWEGRMETTLILVYEQYYAYTDGTYMICPYILVPCGTVDAEDAQMDLSSEICPIRVAVEWYYKDLKQTGV